MARVARVGDTVFGYCRGTYRVWERVGYKPIWGEDENGNPIIIGYDPIYDWVYYEEDGVVTGTINNNGSNVKVNGVSIARIGDSVSLTKHYAHNNHTDPLNITGTITSGSNSVKANGRGVARVGDSVSASGCWGITITSGSNNINAG